MVPLLSTPNVPPAMAAAVPLSRGAAVVVQVVEVEVVVVAMRGRGGKEWRESDSLEAISATTHCPSNGYHSLPKQWPKQWLPLTAQAMAATHCPSNGYHSLPKQWLPLTAQAMATNQSLMVRRCSVCDSMVHFLVFSLNYRGSQCDGRINR
jgi:hypothetical protein